MQTTREDVHKAQDRFFLKLNYATQMKHSRTSIRCEEKVNIY
uniref:Uncharacterized protein n=1 Tax=Arundo donax TaxID=35708 RepID=A0A0A8YL43_ARUDO